MGDRMTPIPFHNLMEWILEEKKETGKVFGVRRPFIKEKKQTLHIFGETLEMPFGPAAGPNTQLAQNIVAAYYTGNRFFELKTVQILDGEDLPVSKPCILADDEGYNCEWSTELRVPEAMEEYIKAWFALKVIAKEFGLGDSDGFIFNMSVGYDLKGIKSEKIDTFINQMMDGRKAAIWQECVDYLISNLDKFKKIDKAFIESISPKVCTSVTVSTLHGCPPQEIESIATYLIKEKQLNTFVKCNPTLLGYETARDIMDRMGYGYVVFGDFHFKDDLQFEDAVPMLKRLQETADREGLEFGVKMTNTFPVDVTRNELPSEEMYMSGRSLAALSLSVAYKLSKAFDGKLRISYSGGADYFNVDKIYSLGIWPITMATTYLKTGGYQRGNQIAEKLEKLEYQEFTGVDVEGLGEFIKEVITDRHYTKGIKPLPSRKLAAKVPLINCFTAPCNKQCPIEQDVPTYLKHVKDGEYLQALRVITDKNALPFITGTICSHTCMSKCTRNFYDESIKIRSAKLVAAQKGYDELIKELKPSDKYKDKKVAVVGAGAAGIASAFFLAREGADVTVFEKRSEAGGIVRYIVPEFRIPREDVEKDVSLAKAMGAKFVFNHKVTDLNELREAGFEDIILAIGATKGMPLGIECEKEINAMEFLETCRNRPEEITIGKNVAIIGAGNTAMDAARAAKRMPGVENVYIVYRRTVKYMPADEEELELAIHDGVEMKELLAPVSHKNGKLICHRMVLGEMDASGRQKPVETEEEVILDIDTVVASLGEKVDNSFYESLGLKINKRGIAEYNPDTMETSVAHVYVTGDGSGGPATVVEAIRDASKAVNAILGIKPRVSIDNPLREAEIAAKKGVLAAAKEPKEEGSRCLECNKICEACVEVCPNRANVSIFVHGAKQPQILHIDYMCNECGNCASFCPYDSAPYKEKFTLFRTIDDFEDSENEGFVPLDMEKALFLVRLGDETKEVNLKDIFCELHVEIKNLMLAVYHDHRYLMLQ